MQRLYGLCDFGHLIPQACASRSAATSQRTWRMHARWPLALLIITLGLASFDARAESRARIVDMQPSTPATLGRNQSFYVRVEYSTDEPISLWARPYRDGHEVTQAMSNASMPRTGSGEALGWFQLLDPGVVDEVRIRAGGGKPYREWDLARQSVNLHWLTTEAAPEPRAAWVDRLSAADQAQMQEKTERRSREPASPGSTALFSGFMLLVLALLVAGIAVPLWTAWKWRGGWRLAAAVPAAVIGFVVLRIVVDTARDPTSHNLWPFEILQFGTVALIAIGALKFARRRLGIETTRA